VYIIWKSIEPNYKKKKRSESAYFLYVVVLTLDYLYKNGHTRHGYSRVGTAALVSIVETTHAMRRGFFRERSKKRDLSGRKVSWRWRN
jgi:hypothetical protein